MTREECERFWRLYSAKSFSNPPIDPTFEDLYQAIKIRLINELWITPWHEGDDFYGKLEALL